MGIGARDFSQSESARYLQRKNILFFRTSAVQNFERVNKLKNLQCRCAIGMGGIDRLLIRIDERKLGIELVTKRMVRDQDAAELIGNPAKLAQLVDSADVPLQA